MQGIYCIEHPESGRKYYGSSMNVEKRSTGNFPIMNPAQAVTVNKTNTTFDAD